MEENVEELILSKKKETLSLVEQINQQKKLVDDAKSSNSFHFSSKNTAFLKITSKKHQKPQNERHLPQWKILLQVLK